MLGHLTPELPPLYIHTYMLGQFFQNAMNHIRKLGSAVVCVLQLFPPNVCKEEGVQVFVGAAAPAVRMAHLHT
jgi:hypothetical protein